ncbi:MAG: pyridoxal phosphate-dependent aminotransferase [Chloroflexi bacterium]|nr:pyridoxal phosphate-dependent aminotransferase [Chloroflexota bacterium]
MKISQRVQDLAESGTIAVSNKVAAMRAQGIDVVSLGAGEPDFDTPDHIKAAAAAALDGGETKYAKPASGVPELKHAVVAKLNRENGLTYSTDQVVASVGGKEALYLAFATLLDPGDEVIIPAPYWVSYPEQVKLAGGVPVFVNAGAEAGFRITPDQLRDALTPRTRVLVFNSPSNPTGAAYSPEETDALAAVLADTDVVTFSDEMYDRLLFGGREFKSFAATSAHAYDHTITFNAGSKSYSMTGWRIGYAAGPVDVIKGMAKLQSQTTSGAATFTMHALAAALNGDQSCVEAMRVEFERRGKFLSDRLNALDGVVCPEPGGAFYAFPDVSGTFEAKGVSGSTEWAGRLLEDAHVGVVPGSDFGADACVRLSFATSMAALETALDRIEGFLAG